MNVVWSDYDTFDSRSVCMKSPIIYSIMARLSRITGLEWAKMYENYIVYWYGVSKRGCLVNIANHTDQTWTKGVYIPRKFSGYSVYTSTVFNGVVPNKLGRLALPTVTSENLHQKNTKSTTQR